MTTPESLREQIAALIEADQVQLLTDYDVSPDAWKGDLDWADAVGSLADAVIERCSADALAARVDALSEALATWRTARIAAMQDVNPQTWQALANAEAGLIAALGEQAPQEKEPDAEAPG